MARLALVLLLAALGIRAQGQQQKELSDAGACSRCHVSSSLEWGISKHAKSSVNCAGCHGESAGHVLNEQNGVKPDRIPRGAAVAGFCATCHQAGCPKTSNKAACQSCHHVHALIDPKSGTSSDQRSKDLDTKAAAYRQQLRSAEDALRGEKWAAARDAFHAALSLNPADAKSRSGLKLAERRLTPVVPGLTIVNNEYDARTGLPNAIRIESLQIDLALIPAGDFDLGSEKRAGAGPVHTVHVEPFYLSRVEVTQAQWKALMGARPGDLEDKMPVAGVSWDDTQAFLAALNRKLPGGGFRLPTEAEWEYAARSGSQGTPQTMLALHPAGTGQPNAFGIYDMVGNVSEWCSSLAKPYPYRAGDGRESLSEKGLRVVRGGNYTEPAEWFDVSERHASRPDQRLPSNGFRLAFSPREN